MTVTWSAHRSRAGSPASSCTRAMLCVPARWSPSSGRFRCRRASARSSSHAIAAAEALVREAQERVRHAATDYEQAKRERVRVDRLVREGFMSSQVAEQSQVMETTSANELQAARFRARSDSGGRAGGPRGAARAGRCARRGPGGDPGALPCRGQGAAHSGQERAGGCPRRAAAGGGRSEPARSGDRPAVDRGREGESRACRCCWRVGAASDRCGRACAWWSRWPSPRCRPWAWRSNA